MVRVYDNWDNECVIFEGDAEELLFEVGSDLDIEELEDVLNDLDTQKVGSVIDFRNWTIEKIANIYD